MAVECPPFALRPLSRGVPWPMGIPLDPQQNYCTSPWLVSGRRMCWRVEVTVFLSLSTIRTINHPAYSRIPGILHCLLRDFPHFLSPVNGFRRTFSFFCLLCSLHYYFLSSLFDTDVLHPFIWFEKLVKAAKQFPKHMCCKQCCIFTIWQLIQGLIMNQK